MNFAIPAAWVRALAEDPAEGPAPRGAFLNQDFVAQMAEEPENWPAWERFCRLWVKDQPDDPDAWLALGHALDRSWREQRLRDPEGPEGLHLESIGAYRRALELRGGQARVWNNLGAALEADNRFAEAETAFLEALRLDPDYGLAWINLGSTRMNTGRCGAAVEAFRKGLERVPDHSETWGRLGYCLAQTGRWAEAVEALRVAVAQRPFQADLWSDLAKAARQAGERELAQEAQARLRALRKGG